MTCSACTIAKVNPCTGRFNAGCKDCDARALAHGPGFFQSGRDGALSHAYRQALRTTFGEGWKAAHETVKQWAERIAAAKHRKVSP